MAAKNIPLKFVKDYGGDGRTLVLLHGFLASSHYWRKLQPLLTAAGYRVITIDLLGFGHSPKPRHGAYDYQDHVDHIQATLVRLQVNEPFILVGHSMGALVSLRLATKNPNDIAALVLVHPPLFATALQAREALRATGRHYRILLYSHIRFLLWGLIRLLPPTGNFKMRHNRRSREESFRRIILAAEAAGDLEKINVKTLAILGLHDRREYIHTLNSIQLSSYVTAVTKDTNHNSPLNQPSLIFKLIHTFVAAI